MPEYLTVRDVAAIYKVNEITVRRHIRSGKLRAAKIGGRVRVRKEDAEALAQPVLAQWHLDVVIPQPTPEVLARRRELAARADALRASMKPLDISVVEIIRQARDPDGDFADG
jgi:excisionase family DNA binding protein